MANRSRRNRIANRASVFGIRPDLMPRETAASHLSRLAIMTGRSIPDMRTEVGIDVRSIDLGDETAIRDLATKCGMGHGALARWSPRRVAGKRWRLHGQELGTEMVDRTFFRFCPACVVEDFDRGGRVGSWMRAEWAIAPIRTCPDHGMALAAVTPERVPFAPYDYARSIIHLERDMPRLADEAGRRDPSSLEVYLRDRLLTGTKGTTWIDGLAFHAAADLSEVFGAVALEGKKVRVTMLPPERRHEAGGTGYDIVAGGPDVIREFLVDLIGQARTGKGVWGPREAIGRIYNVLEARRQDEDYRPAVDLVREILLDNVPLEEGYSVFGTPVAGRRVWNFRMLSRRVGMTPQMLEHILVRNGVISEADLEGVRATRKLVGGADIQAWIDEMDGALSLPKVMRRFSMPRNMLAAFIEKGALSSITRSETVDNAQARFSLRSVAAFEAMLFDDAEDVSEIPAGAVPAMKARASAHCSVAEFVDAFVSGLFAWKGRLAGGTGIDSLLLDKVDVADLFRLPTESGLTRKEVMGRTGLTQRPVQMLFERGLFELNTIRNSAKRSDQVVATEESVDAFMRDNITLIALAAHHGVHFRRMKAIAKAAGIEPTLDPEVFHATFYPRQQAMSLDLGAIDPDDVVVTRRTRAETFEHKRQVANGAKAEVRSAAEVLRDVQEARSTA